MAKYSIGVDFGTLSARALLVDLSNGAEVAEATYAYPHQVMADSDFDGIHLQRTDAFQHPKDYIDAISHVTKEVLALSGINPEDVVGIGIDFTSCTVLPAKADGTPLCYMDKFKNNPQSYVKLWKHHSAENEAQQITALAQESGEKWLDTYGGKVSSEWLFPKLLETYHKAPEVFDECDVFLEAADWLVWQLTGTRTHSSCMAGYKGLWNKQNGYPSNDFWNKVFGKSVDIIGTKVSDKVIPTGSKAGEINAFGASLTGLSEGTAVASPIIDAHASLPASGITTGGKLMIIAGTSSCHIVMDDKLKDIKGICGSVEDGIIPGLTAYESGQASVGDTFDWFVKNCVPQSYHSEALSCNQNIFDYITAKAEKLTPGQSGLVAIDWWNGNRTPYADYDLTGVIVGLNQQTKPEEIYRALIEATAFGTKAIVELYQKNGVEINEIYLAGGISQKNSFMMQLYADVLQAEIKIAKSAQSGAKGSAIFASVAGGYYTTASSAAAVIADKCEKIYYPRKEYAKIYDTLYEAYIAISDFFASGDVMKKLKQIN